MNKPFLLIFYVFFLTANFVNAQTDDQRAQIISHYDLQKLSELEQQFDKTFIAERANALRLAAINGWKETIEQPNGGVAILVGVFSDGTPKYYQTHNRGAGQTTRADRVHTNGGAELNLNGENMIGGVWDGGRTRATHLLLENRVTQIDNPSSLSSHATHVAGTMIGTGSVMGGIAKGMAPEAELLAYDFLNDESEMTAAAATGLLVSNHSYGLRIDNLPLWRIGYYDDNARNLDNIAYNAPYYLPVCSAGNDRRSGQNPSDGGYDYLTDKSVSKNSIIAAAVYQVTNYTGPSSVVMSSFSSWGPTDDGRIKPDISGKGVNTYSSTANTNSSYDNYNGTSMASPSIAGSLLLLQQHYNDIHGFFMLSSTLRGLALHTADEAGSAPGPDYRFGWGLLNIEKAAEVISNNGNESIIIEEELAQGDVYTLSVQANGIDDLVASIAWTDPAGRSPQAGINDLDTPMLVNDLDLRVSDDGGVTFYPWKLNPAIPNAAAINGDNTVDNIEKIEIANASGEYIIRVSHKNELTNDAQAFSLIVTGISREAFAVTTHQGFQSFCPGQLSASCNINLGFSDGFSDTVDFTVSSLPTGVEAILTPNTLNSEGTVMLTLNNIDALAPGEYQIKVTATGTSEVVNVYPIVHILDPQLSAVTLISPVNGEVNQPIDMNFNWEELGIDAEEYDFQLALDPEFTTLVTEITIEENYTLVDNLLENTEYFWRVRATNACGDGDYSEEFNFVTETVVGVDENEISELVIYPNPTTSVLNIKANSIIDSVEIISVLGKSVIQTVVTDSKAQIDTGNLRAGHYFVRIISENKVIVKRFIKR